MFLLSGLERVDFGGCGQSEAMVLPLFWAGLAGAGRGLVWFGSRGLGLTDWVGSGT